VGSPFEVIDSSEAFQLLSCPKIGPLLLQWLDGLQSDHMREVDRGQRCAAARPARGNTRNSLNA
jgi:hypothetical protein